MESLMRSFVKCACSAMDGFFKGFDETVEMLKGGWSLAKDTWNSAFGSAELKPVFDSAFTAFPDYQWVKNHSSALGTTFSGFARRDFAKRLRQGDSGSP